MGRGETEEREMKVLYYEDLDANDEYYSIGRTVTEADIVNFAGLSGDFNPLHMDAEFMKQSVFGARVAHGLLVLSMSDGARSEIDSLAIIAFLEMESVKFIKPVLIGDTIRTRIRVLDKRDSSKPGRGVARLRYEVLNQRDEVAQSRVEVLLVEKRPSAP